MTVRTNAAAAAARIHKAAASIPVANRAGVAAAADAMKSAILTSATSRRWKPSSSWVDVKMGGTTQAPHAVVRLRGHRAYWAQAGTQAHDIRPKNRKAILTPDGPRAGARVKGAKPRPFFREGITAGTRPAAAASDRAIVAGLRKGMGG